MSRIVVLQDCGRWQVWCGLDDDDFTPPEGFCFIIGTGATRNEALAAAVADLEAAVDVLQTGAADDRP